MNVYYDVEDNHYRTYPDGDIATVDQMRELIENKNVSIVKLQQENKQFKEMFEDSKTYSKEFLYKHNKNLLEANERLYRENKQLKSKLEMYENGVYYSSENDKLKEVIEEVRECLNTPWILADYETGEQIHKKKKELLQILDKVKDVK